ncbi:hypothetical protein SAMN05216564_11611 [Halopenitus persicus]|uniref:Uncharacterized protein n=2 Tax=Halopenitus persicus TaxID=1048396 RepID=A0A1H3NW99_9EURY|nr:hypothetical protein SAMN05216564_11611 [Halopenitus persicus]
MGQTVTVGDRRMTVENPRIRKAVVTTGMAHTRVVTHAGQFVVVDVLINGAQPDVRAGNLDLWSSVDEHILSDSDPLSSLVGESAAYAFTFPARRHDRAAIVHRTDGAESGADVYWNLPAPHRERLTFEPKFTVSSFRVPKHNGQRALELTVANEGKRDGTFRARVSLKGFSGGSIVEFPVPAGESRTYTGSPGDILLYLENQGGGTLTVQYPADGGLTSVERTVQLSRTATGSNT